MGATIYFVRCFAYVIYDQDTVVIGYNDSWLWLACEPALSLARGEKPLASRQGHRKECRLGNNSDYSQS